MAEGFVLLTSLNGPLFVAIGVASLVVAAGITLFATRGGDDPQPSNSDGTPAANPTATATATSTPPFADFGPTLTPEQLAQNPGFRPTPSPSPTQLPALTTIAGKPVRELTIGDPVDFPQDMVMLANLTCYGCAGGFNIHRVYRDASSELHVESVMPPVATGPRGGAEPYVHSFSNYGLYQFFAALCTGYCGGEGEPAPGSTLELWRSLDGGVAWVKVAGSLPLGSYLVGSGGGEVVVETPKQRTSQSAPLEYEYTWYPEPRPLVPPPAGLDNPRPHLSYTYGLMWFETGSRDPLTSDITFSNQGGRERTLQAPGESRLHWSIGGRYTWPKSYWIGSQPSYNTPHYVAITDSETGVLEAVYRTNSPDVRVADSIDGQRLIGNFHSIHPVQGIQQFFPALIDLNTGVIHQLRGLPPEGQQANRYTFPLEVYPGPVVRVNAGAGDCLNVRSQPSATSTSEGCYTDGVILTTPGEPVDGSWARVWGPSGPGWAAQEFLLP